MQIYHHPQFTLIKLKFKGLQQKHKLTIKFTRIYFWKKKSFYSRDINSKCNKCLEYYI